MIGARFLLVSDKMMIIINELDQIVEECIPPDIVQTAASALENPNSTFSDVCYKKLRVTYVRTVNY